MEGGATHAHTERGVGGGGRWGGGGVMVAGGEGRWGGEGERHRHLQEDSFSRPTWVP